MEKLTLNSHESQKNEHLLNIGQSAQGTVDHVSIENEILL